MNKRPIPHYLAMLVPAALPPMQDNVLLSLIRLLMHASAVLAAIASSLVSDNFLLLRTRLFQCIVALLAWAGLPTAMAHQSDPVARVNAGVTGAVPALTLMVPDAGILKDGYIYLPFRVDHLTIRPLYTEVHGTQSTKTGQPIGHLHVRVDGNAWSWIHASTDPLYFGPLPAGVHRVTVELANASHAILQTQSIEVTVPPRA